MTTSCRFTTCNWRGACDDLFTHCEDHHRRCIKTLIEGNRYDFTFDDLPYEAYLLCGEQGLYWFCLDLLTDALPNSDQIKRGIFAIGESEPIEYTLKLGLIRDGHADYLGPFKSRPEEPNTEIYDLVFSFGYLQFMNEEMPSRVMRLYVGTFDDSDDQYQLSPEELDWTNPKECEINQLCLEKFTCAICLEYIRRDARFCERQHFVCLKCFDEMFKRRQLRCPTCRSDYPYDCQDARVEELLRMVKFPEDAEEEIASRNNQACCSKSLRLN